MGLGIAVSVSTAKGSQGMLGLILLPAGLGSAWGIFLVLRGALKAVETIAQTRYGIQLDSLVRSLHGAALFSGAGAFASCVVLAAEAFGPPEGHVKAHFARHEAEKVRKKEEHLRKEREAVQDRQAQASEKRRKDQEADRARIEKKAQLEREARVADRKLWQSADLILMNPPVAVRVTRRGSETQFAYLTSSAAPDDREPLRDAWELKIPVSDAAPALARRFRKEYQRGEALKQDDSGDLRRAVEFHPFLPASGQLVEITAGTERKRRVGHLLGTEKDVLLFSSLIPHARLDANVPDRIQTERIPRSEMSESHKLLSEASLRSSADFLEYCHFKVLESLQREALAEEGLRLRPSVFIDAVAVQHGLSHPLLTQVRNELKLLKSKANREMQSILLPDEQRDAYGRGHIAWAVFAREALSELDRKLREKYLAERIRKEYEARREELELTLETLESLVQVSRKITDESLAQIVQAGVTVVERGDRVRQLYCRLQGGSWPRPATTAAIDDGLIQASHILLTEVDRPRDKGTYHLAMKLVRLRDGKIIWADQGDRYDARNPLFRDDAKVHDLRGRWRNAANNLAIEITGDDSHIQIRQSGSHPGLANFGLTATRRRNRADVTSAYFVFAFDPGRVQRAIKAELRILDEKLIEITTPRVREFGMPISWQGTEKTVFEKQ